MFFLAGSLNAEIIKTSNIQDIKEEVTDNTLVLFNVNVDVVTEKLLVQIGEEYPSILLIPTTPINDVRKENVNFFLHHLIIRALIH